MYFTYESKFMLFLESRLSGVCFCIQRTVAPADDLSTFATVL